MLINGGTAETDWGMLGIEDWKVEFLLEIDYDEIIFLVVGRVTLGNGYKWEGGIVEELFV